MKKLCVVLFIVSCLVCAVRAEESAGTKGSLPPPEKNEMKINELKLAPDGLDGKIVKTIISSVLSFDSAGEGRYRAYCGYYGDDSFKTKPSLVLAPEGGKEFFMALAKKGLRGDGLQAVYLRIHSKKPIQAGRETFSFEAVGNLYDETSNTYSWVSASNTGEAVGFPNKKLSARDTPQELSRTDTTAALPLPPPEKKEVKMSELKSQLVDLDGKVVPALINHVYDLEQVEKGKYRAWCDWWGKGLNSPQRVIIPEEGMEFFRILSKQDNYDGGGKIIYLRIRGKNVEAVGSRYSKSKGEYSW